MKEYLVSLHVTTSMLSLGEVSSILGREGGSSSHDKGSLRGCHDEWDYTAWKLEANQEEIAPLDMQLKYLASNLSKLSLDKRLLPPDVELFLDIAVLYDTFEGSVTIPSVYVKKFIKYDVDIRVTSYPKWSNGLSNSD